MNRKLLNVKEVSELTGLSENTIYCWVSQGSIPFVKLGRLTRFDLQRSGTWISGNGTEKRILKGQTRPIKAMRVTLAAK